VASRTFNQTKVGARSAAAAAGLKRGGVFSARPGRGTERRGREGDAMRRLGVDGWHAEEEGGVAVAWQRARGEKEGFLVRFLGP
jgi:hypothetical protein